MNLSNKKIKHIHLLDPVTNKVSTAICIIPDAKDITFNDGKNLQQKYDSGELFIPTGYGLNLIPEWNVGIEFVKSENRVDIVPYDSGLYLCKNSHISSNEITPENEDYWINIIPSLRDIEDQTGSFVKIGENYENAERIELFLKSTDNSTIEICDSNGRRFKPITDAKLVNYNDISLYDFLRLTNTLLDNSNILDMYNTIKSDEVYNISNDNDKKRINLDSLTTLTSLFLNELKSEEDKIENIKFKEYTKEIILGMFDDIGEEDLETEHSLIDDENESTTKSYSSSKIGRMFRSLKASSINVDPIIIEGYEAQNNIQSILETLNSKLEETFQSADSFKSGICEAIGNPLNVNDSKEQIITKINVMKNKISSSIQSSECEIGNNLNLNSLINNIVDLNNNKNRIQMGQVIPFLYSSTGITVSSKLYKYIYDVNLYSVLEFVPKIIYLFSRYEYHDSSYEYGNGYNRTLITSYENLSLNSIDENFNLARIKGIISASKDSTVSTLYNLQTSDINFTQVCESKSIEFNLKKIPLLFSSSSISNLVKFPVQFIAIR